MKKVYFSLFISTLIITTGFAQTSVPLSWTEPNMEQNLKPVVIAAPDVSQLLAEDEVNMKNGKAFRVGVVMEVDYGVNNSGHWDFTSTGAAIWRMKMSTSGAYALSLSFSEFYLPEGATLYLYNEDRTHVVGPFTSADNAEDLFYSSPLINASDVIVEYNQPANVYGTMQLQASEFAYYYRPEAVYGQRDIKDLGDSDPCEVNANCSEGSSWGNQKRSAVRLLLKEGSDTFFCSGSMLNNALQDCTPYLLTAQHCGSAASHQDMRSWKFYFNYEAPGCTDPASEGTLASQVITGCVKMAASGPESEVTKSDFLLVVLKSRPISSYNAYLSGWNRDNAAASSGVSIHHPAGDIKKISTFSSSAISTTWDGTPGSHWRVTWVATANGHGVTEGGSSGSPLFNSAGLVVGDLSGGGSFCNSPNSPDSYGKLSYSWQSCGATDNLRLKPWLDRNNSGATFITGKENNCAAQTFPTVDFEASNLFPAVGETVTLTDMSTGSPFYWQYYITPTTVNYVNGTNMYSQNPQVQFTATGTYSVIMYAVNTGGYAYKNRVSYIHVGLVGVEDEENSSPVNVYPNPNSGDFVVSFDPSYFDAGKLKVTVQDIQGKTLFVANQPDVSANLLQMNLPGNITDGLYFVTISDDAHRITKRVSVTR